MGRAPLSRDVQVSKKIAWLLRHGAEKEGLQMSAAGYANVQDVLNNRNIRSFKVTFQELYDMVQSNDKKRFSIMPAGGDGNTNGNSTATQDTATDSLTTAIDASRAKPSDFLIRANQGHSVVVESESLLTRIDADSNNIPAVCVHGTTHGAWPLIVASGGLKAMTRRHVHFASGLPAGFTSLERGADDQQQAQATAPVISGMRNSSTVLVYLDITKALAGGLKFWLSENGVILTEGDEQGLVPISYFHRVEDRTGGLGVLVADGQITKEHPASWEKKGRGARGSSKPSS